jgi:hypothetical protein
MPSWDDEAQHGSRELYLSALNINLLGRGRVLRSRAAAHQPWSRHTAITPFALGMMLAKYPIRIDPHQKNELMIPMPAWVLRPTYKKRELK